MAPKVLIVEDEDALTLLLRYNLEAEGYEVECVARSLAGYPYQAAGADIAVSSCFGRFAGNCVPVST